MGHGKDAEKTEKTENQHVGWSWYTCMQVVGAVCGTGEGFILELLNSTDQGAYGMGAQCASRRSRMPLVAAAWDGTQVMFQLSV